MPVETTVRAADAATALHVRWDRSRAIVNLRGGSDDTGLVDAVSATVGLSLPTQTGGCPASTSRRIVWAVPDDWFVLGEPGAQYALAAALRAAAAGRHQAVTDVSSYYCVLRLAGAPVCEVPAQGCPLGRHSRAFPAGRGAGTHFFKASVWLWRTDDDGFERLVRTSFAG